MPTWMWRIGAGALWLGLVSCVIGALALYLLPPRYAHQPRIICIGSACVTLYCIRTFRPPAISPVAFWPLLTLLSAWLVLASLQ